MQNATAERASVHDIYQNQYRDKCTCERSRICGLEQIMQGTTPCQWHGSSSQVDKFLVEWNGKITKQRQQHRGRICKQHQSVALSRVCKQPL